MRNDQSSLFIDQHRIEHVTVNRIAVIGGGLMGSSVLRAFRSFSCAQELSVFDRSETTSERLRQLGLADRICANIDQAVHDADVVILAVPLREYSTIVQTIATIVPSGCMVSDVGSVKAPVADTFARMLPGAVPYIPAHPVAGLEKTGPDAGSASMFINKWLVVTPPSNCARDAVDRISAIWRQVGAKVAVMTPEEHDDVMAVISHLPHLLSFCMMMTAAGFEARSGRQYMQYSAGGFRDFTRIAGSDPIMWKDILLENSDNILSALDSFTDVLRQLSETVRSGDERSLLDYLQKINVVHSTTFGATVPAI